MRVTPSEEDFTINPELKRICFSSFDCVTCSGRFSFGGFNYNVQNKIIRYVDGFTEGMKFLATDTNMSISTADERYMVSFAMKNYTLERLRQKNAELHVINAILPDALKSAYMTIAKKTEYNSKFE